MITLTCTYVSKSGKSALFTATKDHGPVSANLGSGFMQVNEEIAVGDEIELDYESVETVHSTTDDGQVFNWLTFH